MIWKIYNCTPLLCNHIHWHFDIFKELTVFFFKMKFVYFVNFKNKVSLCINMIRRSVKLNSEYYKTTVKSRIDL